MSAPELPPREAHGCIISPTNELRYITGVNNEGVEWCTMKVHSKGSETHEERLAMFDKEIDEKLRHTEQMQKAWETEYRAKMLKNVIHSRLPEEKK